MKQLYSTRRLFGVAALLSVAGHASAVTLFSDSFDRADETALGTTTAGMGGTLSPLSYVETFEGSGAPSSIAVVGNELEMARGAGMSSMYLDHNFIDGQILTDGLLTISLDVTGFLGLNQDDRDDRFVAFGIGMSAAEAFLPGDVSFGTDGDDPDPIDPSGEFVLRPYISDVPAPADDPLLVADFVVSMGLDGNITMWADQDGVATTTAVPDQNVNVATVPDGSSMSGTLAATFEVSDFNAGSTVTAKVFFNGTQVGVDQVFTWSGTDENFIGLAARANQVTTSDNLVISTDAIASPVIGDTDGDGDIDDFDLLNAISNFTGSLAAGTGGRGIPEGDTDADADVDDFDLLNMISGFTGSLSAPNVPEPASLAMLGLGGLALTRRRRCR